MANQHRKPYSKDVEQFLGNLSESLRGFVELLARGTNPSFALTISGMSDQEVRKVLSMDNDAELTLDNVVSALVAQAKRVNKRLDKVETDRKADQRTINQTANAVNELGKRVEEDHDTIVASVLPRLQQIEEFLGSEDFASGTQAWGSGGEKSFIRTLRQKGHSDEDIRKVLNILKGEDDGDLDLTNDDFIVEFYTDYAANKEWTADRLINHDDRIVRIEEILGENLVTRETIVEIVEDRHRISPVGCAIGFIVGVIVWLLVWLQPIHGAGPVFNTDHTKVIGGWEGGFSSFWLGIALGLVFWGIITALTAGMSHRHRTETTTEEAEDIPRRRSIMGRFRAWRARRREHNAPNARLLQDRHEEEQVREAEERPAATPA